MPKEQTPRGRRVGDGVLAGHYRRGQRFTPPLLAMPGAVTNDWVTDDLPDLVWMVCLVHFHGDEAVLLFRKLQELMSSVVGSDDHDVRVDGRLTSLEAIPEDPRSQIVEAVHSAGFAEGLFGPEILGVFRLYPGHPGAWLVSDPRTEDAATDADEAMNFLAQAIIAVIVDRHLNALVKAPTLGWLLLQGRLVIPPNDKGKPFEELLVDYPTDVEKRGMADAVILSSFLSEKGVDEQLRRPGCAEAREDWARAFWRRNRAISACIPEYETEPDTDLGGESGDLSADEPGDDDAGAPSVAGLVSDYQNEVWRLARALHDRVYDPDTQLDLHRPARSEVLVGIATRCVRAVESIIAAPHQWTGEHGAWAVRTLFESEVTMRWLLKHAAHGAFEDFQAYGVGKRKLLRRHLETLAEELGDSAPEELAPALEMYAVKTGDELGEEFLVVSVEPTFSGLTLRQMADEVGELEGYNHIFQSASGVAHGEWWALEDYALQRCVNPLHRFHQLPHFDVNEPAPNKRFPTVLISALREVVDLTVDNLVDPSQPED